MCKAELSKTIGKALYLIYIYSKMPFSLVLQKNIATRQQEITKKYRTLQFNPNAEVIIMTHSRIRIAKSLSFMLRFCMWSKTKGKDTDENKIT